MVMQRDAKSAADIGQPRRVDSPLRASKLDRADEWNPRHLDTICGATREEDVPVERRVVGGDELSVVDPGAQGRPELAEGGCIVHVLPAKATSLKIL